MSNGKSGGCLKGLAVGCGSCFVLTAILVGATWMGWGTIRDIGPFKKMRTFFETAKGEAVQMSALSNALLAKYPSRKIDVHVAVNSTNGVTVKALIVDVVGPTFEIPSSGEGKAALAREIADAVAANDPTLSLYDELRLTITEEGDGGSNLGSTSSFQFATRELREKAGATH